jgi:hypothetical protein
MQAAGLARGLRWHTVPLCCLGLPQAALCRSSHACEAAALSAGPCNPYQDLYVPSLTTIVPVQSLENRLVLTFHQWPRSRSRLPIHRFRPQLQHSPTARAPSLQHKPALSPRTSYHICGPATVSSATTSSKSPSQPPAPCPPSPRS